MSDSSELSLSWRVSSHSSGGEILHRSRVNFANTTRPLDIRVQFSGVEMIDLCQYQHTWDIGIIDLPSLESSSGTSQAMKERVSGGNLLTGFNRFLKEGIKSRISCILVSRDST